MVSVGGDNSQIINMTSVFAVAVIWFEDIGLVAHAPLHGRDLAPSHDFTAFCCQFYLRIRRLELDQSFWWQHTMFIFYKHKILPQNL